MLGSAIIAGAATIATALGGRLHAYSITSHGQNPWSVEAALNAVRHAPYVEKSLHAVNGKLGSFYRSPQVNAAAGGVPNSDHLTGNAWDVDPVGAVKFWDAWAILSQMVKRGELGQVRQLIAESYKNVIHVGMYEQDSAGATEYLEQYAPGQHRKLTV